MSLGPIHHQAALHHPPAIHFEARFTSSKGCCVGDRLSIVIPNIVASIIKIPPSQPPVSSETTFDQLACSSEDVQKISRLISVMGENGKVVLLFKYQKELRQIGREIEHVHPLKFISTVMSNAHLKTCLKSVYSDYFKWTNFMDGIGNGLTSQHKQGKVVPYLNDFAKACGVDAESLKPYIENQDWENMIIYLMNS